MRTKNEIPQPYARTVGGFFFSFYSGKAPTRLLVVLIVFSVEPFADEVASHTSHDSDDKRSNDYHKNTSSCCQVSVGQHNDHIILEDVPQYKAYKKSKNILDIA